MVNKDNKREQALLICMPWRACANVHREPHTKAECFVCHGEVAINAHNFGSGGVPSGYQPICGACAVDMIDADAEGHTFGLTERQKADPRIAAIEALAKDKWSTVALDHVRRNRAKYDARPSAPARDN
jgi:hypothetical protein